MKNLEDNGFIFQKKQSKNIKEKKDPGSPLGMAC